MPELEGILMTAIQEKQGTWIFDYNDLILRGEVLRKILKLHRSILIEWEMFLALQGWEVDMKRGIGDFLHIK
jgi:hypothetical protein